tara:strand:- start:8126 stop:8812 length:687 start_codon:yes stop_codon:yes gene_type:complete
MYFSVQWHNAPMTISESDVDGVILVLNRRVHPGREAAYEQWRQRIAEAERAAPGFLSREDIPPLPDGQDWHTSIIRFESAALLDQWIATPTCRALLEAVEPLCGDVAKSRITPGFDGWFPPTDGAVASGPPPWKMTLGVVLALYPSIFLISWIFTSRVDWAFPVKLLVSNLLAVACVSWISMPLVRKLLGTWLGPRNAVSLRRDIAGTVAIVIGLLAMLWIFLQVPMD